MHGMNAYINIKTGKPNRGKTAFLFLLALLMLVVSCPFKRLLQADSHTRVAAHPSPKRNGIESQTAAYDAKFCCAQKQKITLVTTDSKEQKLQALDFISAQHVQTGFALHYFLSGTEKHFSNVEPALVSSLPLFLQHRRLLI